MGLRSLSFHQFCGVDELPLNVLNLFSPLSQTPEKKLEYAYEIIVGGLRGKINFSSGFNLEGYEMAVKKNYAMALENTKKKNTFIVMEDDGYEDFIRNGGTTLDLASVRMVRKMEDEYEKLLDNEELEHAVETIKALNEEYIKSEGIDLIVCIKSALKGIPDAVNTVKQLCLDNSLVAEYIKVILECKTPVEELFAC